MVRRAILWTAVGQILAVAITFGGTVALARLLTPHETGIYAVGLATAGALQVLGAFGVGNYIVRTADVTENVLATAFTVNAIINASVSVLMLLLSEQAGVFLKDPAVTQVLRVLAIAPLIAILDLRPFSMMQRSMQFHRISLVNICQSAVNMSVSVASAVAGASYMSAAYGAIAAALTGTIGYSFFGRQHIGLRFGLQDWRVMTVFGLRMMSVAGVTALASRLSDIVVGRMLGLSALGLFSRASAINMMLFQNVYGTAARVIFVKLSQVYNETGKMRDTFLRALRSISTVMGPVLLGTAVLSKPMVLLLFGERWLGSAVPLSLLLIAQFITLRFAMSWELFVIKDELRVQTRIEAIRSTFSVFSRAAGSLFSIAGAAAASIIDAFLAIFLYGRHTHRMLGTTRREMALLSFETTALSAVAVAPAIVLMIVYRFDPHTPLPLVVASVVTGAALWLWAIVRHRHPLSEELQLGIAFLHQRLGRR